MTRSRTTSFVLAAVLIFGFLSLTACRDGVASSGAYRLLEKRLATGESDRNGKQSTSLQDAPGLQDLSLSHGGRTRSFLLYTPRTSGNKGKLPLVIVLHCGGCDATRMLGIGMNELAEREGILVAYPNGTSRKEGKKHFHWNAGAVPAVGYAEKNNIDDTGFIRAMVADIKARRDVDSNRIYVTGVSKGGMLAYRLACEMSTEIAAIAPVAATLQLPPERCRPSRPVPLLHIHGSADRNVPLEGGKEKYTARKADYRAVSDVLDDWRKMSSCSNSQEVIYSNKDASCKRYLGCAKDAEVTMCVVEGGGHVWPGPNIKPNEQQENRGEYISPYLDATEVIWQFFERHDLPSNQKAGR